MSECRWGHCLGQHHAVPLHPSGAGGRMRPHGEMGGSDLEHPEGPVRTSRRWGQGQGYPEGDSEVHPMARVQGSPVSEVGPWEIERGTTTPLPCPKHTWVPGAGLKYSSWVLWEKVCEWGSW